MQNIALQKYFPAWKSPMRTSKHYAPFFSGLSPMLLADQGRSCSLRSVPGDPEAIASQSRSSLLIMSSRNEAALPAGLQRPGNDNVLVLSVLTLNIALSDLKGYQC